MSRKTTFSPCMAAHILSGSHHADGVRGEPQLRVSWCQSPQLLQERTLDSRVEVGLWLVNAIERVVEPGHVHHNVQQ